MEKEKRIQELEIQVKNLEQTLEHMIQAQEEDYRTVSADLHDELGQSLTSILLRVKMLQGENDLSKVRSSLEELEIEVKDSLTEVRRFSKFLRPIILETMGLIPALEWHAENFEAQTGIRTYFKYNAKRIRFPEKVETHVYRILQEAFNNIYKHADPSMVAVAVSYQQERFVMSIRDYGKGFDTTQMTTGMGLVGMKERAKLIGGVLTIQSTIGKGTHILLDCIIPQELQNENHTVDKEKCVETHW